MYARCLNYTFRLEVSEIIIKIYIGVFSVNSESVFLLAFVKGTLMQIWKFAIAFALIWK